MSWKCRVYLRIALGLTDSLSTSETQAMLPDRNTALLKIIGLSKPTLHSSGFIVEGYTDIPLMDVKF